MKENSLTKTVDRIEFEVIQLRNDNNELHYEMATLRKELKAHKERLDVRKENAKTFLVTNSVIM